MLLFSADIKIIIITNFMKQNTRISQNDEIDLREIIKKLCNEKILIFFITFFFTVGGYMYGSFQPKIYKTEIILRNAPTYLYNINIERNPQSQSQSQSQLQLQSQSQLQIQLQSIAIDFENNVKLHLLSLDTLFEFVQNNNDLSDFKKYLKEKDISVENYFQGKLKSEIDKNKIINKYSLTYLKPLQGETFLNNYIIFVYQKALITMKKQLTQVINQQIRLHQQHLEIAETIDLKNPILQSMVEGRSVLNEPEALFYKGTKVLSKQILYLTQLLDDSKNLTLDYNPILEQSKNSILVTKPANFFMAIAFVLGLFLSFVAVFIKSKI
jgi:LPS O-antigen subunit length determinant protein (WzzB/FepE family)